MRGRHHRVTHKFRPLSNAVVIRPDKDADKTASGILFLPVRPVAREGYLKGTVVKVGPGRLIRKGKRRGQVDPLIVKPGDRVIYGTWEDTQGCADRHEVDGEQFDVMAEEYIEAIIG